MEQGQEATQESSRRGPRQIGWVGPERGRKAVQPRKWPQGWPGQEPQEADCRVTQRARPGDSERRGNRGGCLDSRPFRIPRYRPGLWRNPLFAPALP
jgi:hypothetical protein